MTLKERVRALARSNNISLPALEETLGFGAGTISKWDRSTPNADKLNAVAKYFGVSMDYLLTGEDDRTIVANESQINDQTTRSERDIARRLKQILKDLKTLQDDLTFESEPLDDKTRELLKVSLESSIRIAKINAQDECISEKDEKKDEYTSEEDAKDE